MSHKIIVPTDFSQTSFSAARFACQLALEHNFTVYLFHCYNSKTSLFDEKINEKEPNNAILTGDLLMTEWRASLMHEYPTVNIDSKCSIGLITEILPTIAIEPNFSMIIIGSNGLEQKDSPVFGSTTSQIAIRSRIPVLAIPQDIKQTTNKKVALLTNFKADELDSLQDFIKKVYTPQSLDIIHVYPISEDLESIEKQIENWKNKIQEILPNANISTILKPINYNDKEQDTIPEVVNLTLNEQGYDIVIVTKTRKSFFEKWFSRSISKDVILKLETTVFFDNN